MSHASKTMAWPLTKQTIDAVRNNYARH